MTLSSIAFESERTRALYIDDVIFNFILPSSSTSSSGRTARNSILACKLGARRETDRHFLAVFGVKLIADGNSADQTGQASGNDWL